MNCSANNKTSVTGSGSQLNRLQLIRQIAGLTATVPDLSQLLEQSLQLLTESLATTGGGIYQLYNSSSPQNLVAAVGISPQLCGELQKVPAGKGLIAQAINTASCRQWYDLDSEPQLYCRGLLEAGWKSLLALPLIAHQNMLGTLFLYQDQPRKFTAAEMELLQECCLLLAAAINSSELVEKLEWQNRLNQASQRELDRSRKQLREHVHRLEESNRSLELANRMKDRFMTLASHELRTPVTWILSATEMLHANAAECSEENLALLKTIEKGGNRLNTLIEELLEIVRLESNDIYLAKESVDLTQLLGQLGEEFAVEAERLRLSLELRPYQQQRPLFGDRHHLHKAFVRILKNAIKFTPAGGFVRLEAVDRTAQQIQQQRPQLESFCNEFFQRDTLPDHVEIRITDSGVGVSPQDRLQIFDKFYAAGDISLHGKQQNAQQGPSAGLGLPLAKGLIEAHGGMIWVDGPQAGPPGSCFHILLPLSPPQRQTDDQ